MTVDYDLKELFAQAKNSNRVALARLISVVERGGPRSRELALLSYAGGGQSYLVGLTGAPGAGKSSLVGALIPEIRKRSQEVSVLAIDPTSPFSGGAILGDRVRMQDFYSDPGVYIRSMATRGHLGGLALAVPDAVRVLDAAGFPFILLETVGVGQVEVEVVRTADTTVVVVNPGWGDSVQANKAGLMEIADVFVINKADRDGTRETRRDLESMLEMSKQRGWIPPIVETVATSGRGADQALEAILAHRSYLESTGERERKREERLKGDLQKIVLAELNSRIEKLIEDPVTEHIMRPLLDGGKDPYSVAGQLLDILVKGDSSS